MRSFLTLALALAAICRSALAEECTPRHSQFQNCADFRNYIWNVADYFEAPPRVLASSLPQAVQEKIKPTGKLVCKGAKGSKYEGKKEFELSAQLTGRKDRITTAAHAFTEFDGWSCSAVADPLSCNFIIKTRGVETAIPVAATIKLGLRCPNHTSVEDDWAVLQLKTPVEDVEPYRVDAAKARSLKVGDKVATVGFSGDFLPRDGGIGPKHYGECNVLNAYGSNPTTGVSTACGCSHGCSGGSLLSADPNPALLGIVVQIKESLAEMKAAQQAGRPAMKHWQKDGNGTYYVTFTGEFLEAVNSK